MLKQFFFPSLSVREMLTPNFTKLLNVFYRSCKSKPKKQVCCLWPDCDLILSMAQKDSCHFYYFLLLTRRCYCCPIKRNQRFLIMVQISGRSLQTLVKMLPKYNSVFIRVLCPVHPQQSKKTCGSLFRIMFLIV